jgi:hypothetical protein
MTVILHIYHNRIPFVHIYLTIGLQVNQPPGLPRYLLGWLLGYSEKLFLVIYDKLYGCTVTL